MQIDVLYPDRAAERRILIDTTGDAESTAKPAMTAEDLAAMQRLVRRLPVGDSVVEAILDLVRGAPPRGRRYGLDEAYRLGTGPPCRPGSDAGLARPCAGRRPALPLQG